MLHERIHGTEASCSASPVLCHHLPDLFLRPLHNQGHTGGGMSAAADPLMILLHLVYERKERRRGRDIEAALGGEKQLSGVRGGGGGSVPSWPDGSGSSSASPR